MIAERAYNNPEWRKVLLETPSGFALFEVDEFIFEEPEDIWVYFSDLTAEKFLFVLGFVKFNDKAAAWDGETRRSKELMRLIHKFCDDKIDLFVQSADLQAVITKKLNVKCSYDPSVADELVWGLKNILHGVLREEKDNITREYYLPMSKGLQRFLQDNLINVSQTNLNADFISQMGLVQYINISLKKVPKILRESYDEYVCKIGDSIQNDLKYAKVLARILVPELTPVYDLSKMFSPDLVIKIQEAEKAATQYRKEKLTMRDMETIFGGLNHLLTVPNQRDDVMTRLKLTEAKLRRAEEDCSAQPVRTMTFRRTLLETPSGFAIFDVSEALFESQSIWSWFTDEMDARLVVLALGFVKVEDKSIARNSCDGPGEELSRLIQKLCAHKENLIVQDDDLKAVIEEKLVDVNVRRIAQRLGWLRDWSQLSTMRLSKLYTLHRQAITFGKVICTNNPTCGTCPLTSKCEYYATGSYKPAPPDIEVVGAQAKSIAYKPAPRQELDIEDVGAQAKCIAYIIPDEDINSGMYGKFDKRLQEDPNPYLVVLHGDDKGTIMIPCFTANNGSFPLAGTFFQENEVFADHKSSHTPISIEKISTQSYKPAYIYFGSSIASIAKGGTREMDEMIYQKGYICVRGFDSITRQPHPLCDQFGKKAGDQTRRLETDYSGNLRSIL